MSAGVVLEKDTPYLDEALAAAAARDYERAGEIARSAIANGVVHPVLLNLRSYWHEQNGRLGAALADLEHARVLCPGDATILNAVGLCYEKLGRMREALEAFRSATSADPGFGAAHINLGRLYETVGLPRQARASYTTALGLGQNVQFNMAALAAREADWERARVHAGQALLIDPGLAAAEYVLAEAEIGEKDFAAAAGRLERILGYASLTKTDRATALCLLGDAYDGMDRTDEAFSAYAAGNAALRECHASRFANPSVETMRDFVERLNSYFESLGDTDWAPAESAAAGNEEAAASHVFLVGFPRSGTSLVEAVLARHSDVVTTQEQDGLTEGVADLLATRAGLERLGALRGGGLAKYRRSYWRRLADSGIAARGKLLVDKQPYNSIALPLIAKLFPEAKILFGIRDPRDVVFSCFRRRFLMNASNFQLLDLADAARFYDSVMRLAGCYRTRIPLRLHEVRHESLVEAFEPRMREICEFVGLLWNPGMADFADGPQDRPLLTPSNRQLGQGLTASGIGHWRKYRACLTPILPVVQPWVEAFGYPHD
jgi:tetratricopeptide (TPR) repeat protein